MITGLRVVIGMNARSEAASRYRAASEESRRGAVAASRSVLAYGSLSLLLSGVFLAALPTASGYLALSGRHRHRAARHRIHAAVASARARRALPCPVLIGVRCPLCARKFPDG